MRLRRLAGVGVLVAAVATAGLALRPAPADAHAELISTEPASGQQLDAAPEQVVLRFSESVDVADDAVEVLTAGGDRIDVGDPGHPDGEGSSVAVDLPSLEDGTYVVSWRVLSSDSHPVSGAFTFGVGDAAAGVSDADAQALVNDAQAGAGSDRVVGVTYGVVRFAAFAGLVVLIGGAVFVAALWPAGADDPRARRILAGAWWVALGATVLSIPLQATYAAGGSLADAFDPSVIADELGARTGRAWLIRVALLAVVAVVGPRLLRRGTERRTETLLPAAVGGGLALLATITFTGHAVSGDLVGLAVVTDLVHLSAVSVWLGGLALLLGAVLWPAGGVADSRAEVIATRFSDVVSGAVMVIVASGVVQAWRQLGSWNALVDSSYGRLLLVKLGFFALMLAAAAASRSWVRQRARARMASLALSPGPGATRVSSSARAPLSVLRGSVATEVGLAVAVLAVTAALVNAVPGASAVDDAPAGGGPFNTTVHGSLTAIQVTVDPAAVGPTEIEINVSAHDGSPLDPEEVTASLTLPERDIGPLDLTLQRIGPGQYFAQGAEIPFSGTWDLEVVARTTDIDQDRVITEVPVS
ncbi:MAG TPA: FixH family protein [Acidimicrobiales bacterium]|nr:FixH family protein [Acidimicrobiales bacterium]